MAVAKAVYYCTAAAKFQGHTRRRRLNREQQLQQQQQTQELAQMEWDRLRKEQSLAGLRHRRAARAWQHASKRALQCQQAARRIQSCYRGHMARLAAHAEHSEGVQGAISVPGILLHGGGCNTKTCPCKQGQYVTCLVLCPQAKPPGEYSFLPFVGAVGSWSCDAVL